MASSASPIKTVVRGTAIAFITWLALYLTKEHLGRTAALALAGVIVALVVLVVWARVKTRANRATPPAD